MTSSSGNQAAAKQRLGSGPVVQQGDKAGAGGWSEEQLRVGGVSARTCTPRRQRKAGSLRGITRGSTGTAATLSAAEAGPNSDGSDKKAEKKK